MKKKSTIEAQVEASLASLDHIERAETDPYFYTRLKARMERRTVRSPLWLKPALVFPVLALLIGMETFYWLGQSTTNDTSELEAFSDYFGLDQDLSTFEIE